MSPSPKKTTKRKTPVTPAVAVVQKPKWSMKKKLVVIIGSITAIFVVLVAIVLMATNPSVQVSDEFLADIKTTKSSAAYQLMSRDAQATITEDDFKVIIDQIGPILDGQTTVISRDVSVETGSDPSAKVVYEIEGTDGVTYRFTVNLVQKGSKWQVLNFDSKRK
ncbi:hypothetical protein HGB25_03285 [Candidatus Saccharibacteria bacterium]|nr:hypothetical protein [Candidatus Saccharibacteria bacterium]